MQTQRFRSGTHRSRRRTTAVASVTVAALLLGACGGDDDDDDDGAAEPTTPATQAPEGTTPGSEAPEGTTPPAGDGGTLVVALDRDPGFLDPFFVDSNAGRTVAESMFDSLVWIGPDGDYVPGLAESYNVVDDTTIEFVLRDGISFHNGEPFNADAVAYSIERMSDPEVNSHYLPQFESIEEVEIVDDLNVTLHLAGPDAAIIDTLTHLFVVPPVYAEEVGLEGFEQAPVGTGPFTFVSYAADDQTVVAANPDYWADSPKGAPQVDQVTFRVIPEATTRAAELSAGSVDIAMYLNPDQVATVEGSGASVVTYSDLAIDFIQINTGSFGTVAAEATGDALVGFEALSDARVRTALNLAIDREAIVDAYLLGYGSPMGQPFAPGGYLHPSEDLQFAYDPDQAKALLAEAGYGDGLTLEMYSDTSTSSDMISLVTSMFAEVGVTVEVTVLEDATSNDGWVAQQFPHLRFSGWSTPQQILALLLQTGDLISSYSNQEVDALIDEQAAQVDPEVRHQTIDELAQVLHDDAAWVYLWALDAIVGLSARTTGWAPNTTHMPVTNVSVG